MSYEKLEEEMFPPDKYIRIPSVPIFDEHEGLGFGGKPKKVTVEDLEKIAKTCNKKFVEVHAATPISLGHTKDDADSEEEQPKIVGWACYFRTGKLADTDRKALYCDWFIKKKYADVIEDYPHRSIEWYRHTNDINPISLLRSAPERDLPIIKYGKDSSDSVPYKYIFSQPTSTEDVMTNSANPADVDKEMTASLNDQKDSTKKNDSEVSQLAERVERLEQVLQQLLDVVSDEQGEGQDDLMQSDKDEGDMGDEDSDMDDEKAASKKESKSEPKKASKDDEPDKYNESVAGSTNCYVPSTKMEKKEKMSREQDDLIKYEREKAVADAVTKVKALYEKENADLRKHYNYAKAKEAMHDLENKHNVDFGSPEDRAEELDLFAGLINEDRTGEAFDKHFNKVARKYKKKETGPDSKGVNNALRFSREGSPELEFKSTDDVADYVKAWTENPKLTKEDFLKTRAGTK